MEDWIILLGGLGLLLVSLLALLLYSGLFSAVDVKTGSPPIGKAHIAYKDGCGPYNGVGSTFSDSTSIAPNLKQIGLYYDDPAKVPENKLRWAVGAILAEDDEIPDETIRSVYEKENYKFMTLPKVSTSVNCVFPYSTMISIFVAMKRVYPKLNDYVKEYGLEAHPYMEIYFGGDIHFMAPLSNQMDFYSPKAMESEPHQATKNPQKRLVEEREALLIPKSEEPSLVPELDLSENTESLSVSSTEEAVLEPENEGTTLLTEDKETTPVPEGKETTILPEGKETTVLPEGKETTVLPEGKETTVLPEGKETTLLPEVTGTTPLPEREETSLPLEGRQTTLLPEGEETTLLPGDRETELLHEGREGMLEPQTLGPEASESDSDGSFEKIEVVNFNTDD